MGAVIWLVEFNSVDLLESLVSREDDLFTGRQAVDHFDVFGIAAAEPHRTAGCVLTVRRHDEDPIASGLLIERPVGQHHRRGGTPEFELDVERLARVDPLGRVLKAKVNPKGSRGHRGLDLGNSRLIVAAIARENRALAEHDAAEIKLIHHRG